MVVALATKWTGEELVLPVVGPETDTPANAHTDSVSKQNKVFIDTPAICICPADAWALNGVLEGPVEMQAEQDLLEI